MRVSPADPLLSALAAYIARDRVESLIRADYLLPQDGVALIADISGFTPLTEALTHGLSPDQGAEELTHALGRVFTPLIEEIHAFRGSVLKFGGDALIVWYGRDPKGRRAAVIRRALTSAWRMQQAIKVHGQVPTPIGPVTLRMKIGLSYGPVKRFNLGRPEFGYEDVLAGRTLDRMAEAEHHAQPDEIVLDRATLAYLPEAVTLAAQRDEFAVVGRLLRPARPRPWSPLTWPAGPETGLTGRLAAYVPRQIYETLAAGQAQVAELKPVVSLFVQFYGLDYDADPDVTQKLQTYFATAQQVVARYEGRLNRLITGDKGSLIHVIFGAPRTVEEQEIRAVRCALDLQQECGNLPFITMQRIGITVGRVFAGPVGSPNRHDYTTMGDSINLSSRLMQNAADHQILIDAEVQTRLNDHFNLADLGQIRVKGKAEPIPVLAVLGVQAQPEQVNRQRNHVLRPIFGRDEELARLHQRLAAALNGQGSVVTLVGEAGLGKTHLLDHFYQQAQGRVNWANGVSLAYGETLSGYLFISVLRDLIDLPAGHGPDETSRHLLAFCTGLFGPARVAATYPYLARFMGLPLPADLARRVEGLAGESFRWQLFEVVRELLIGLLQRRPLVLALDDLQWADPTSLQLLEAVLPLAAELPLILLLALRPERQSRVWALRAHLQARPEARPPFFDLLLETLDFEASAALVADTAPNLPARIVTHLVEKSAGNPLFLVEMVRALEAQGFLSATINLEQIPLEALNLPDSIQGLLLAQIDRLAVETRHTLQLASVIGETFFYQVLAILTTAEQDLDRQLATLETGKYIRPRALTDLGSTYSFRHVLIQESAYSTLLYERRRAYHRQVAEALESLFPNRIAEQAGLLAYHYERATDLERAIYFHLQSADQARLLYANEEAESLYHKVLALMAGHEAATGQTDPERRARTYLKLAQVRANALDFEGAQEFYNQAFDLLEQVERTKPAGPPSKRTFRWGVYEHGPLTLDPARLESVDESDMIQHLFEGLVELDAELNVVPALARRWQVDQEGRRYRFELRSNLKWSDGTPLTARDFVFAWRRNLQPQTEAAYAHLLYLIEGAAAFHRGEQTDPENLGIRAIDDLTLEITLAVPARYFPYLLTTFITYPQPADIIQAKGEAWAEPENLVNNGPFVITRWQASNEITIARNPFYRGLSAGNIQQVTLRFIEPTLSHYLAEEIDWCRVDDQANVPSQYPSETLLIQYLTTFFLGFACQTEPFRRPQVRRAFAHSIDRTELVRTVWANVQRPAAGGVVPPGISGHSPEIGLTFDPNLARRLLAQAGFTTGAGLPPITIAALEGFGDLPNYLQQSWRDHLGVTVRIIDGMDFEELIQHMKQGAVQMGLLGYDVDYPDPDSILRGFFHRASPINCFGWPGNQQFDHLIEQAASATEQSTRMALYHQADRLLVTAEAVIAPLYYWQGYGLLRSGFKLEGAGKIIRGSVFKLKNVSVTDLNS